LIHLISDKMKTVIVDANIFGWALIRGKSWQHNVVWNMFEAVEKEKIELVISEETVNEIDRTSNLRIKQLLINTYRLYCKKIIPLTNEIRKLAEELKKEVPEATIPDLRIIITASKNNLTFVTLDYYTILKGNVLKKIKKGLKKLNLKTIQIVDPRSLGFRY